MVVDINAETPKRRKVKKESTKSAVLSIGQRFEIPLPNDGHEL
jgi:hypothetical protein